MKKNLGTADRALRAIVGIAVLGYGIYAQTWWGALGLIPLATATVGVCGLYLPFGLSTCKVEKAK